MMNGWYGNGWGGSWGAGGWLVMAMMFLLFWGGLVGLVIYLVRQSQTRNGAYRTRPAHNDAEHILADRFARGEIDEEEFIKRRTALRRTE